MRAISVGSVVPSSFFGQIHSVFPHTINIQVQGSETLISVYASQTTDLPQGIRVTALDEISQPASLGQTVERRGEILRLSEGSWIDLRPARRYTGSLEGCAADHLQRGERLEWIRQAGKAHQQRIPAMASAVLELRITAALEQLKSAARAGDRAGLESAAATLTGLGPGLTPTGDDILVGFAAGLGSAALANPARLRTGALTAAAIHQAAARTNDISRTYLLLAARGLFPSSLVRVCSQVQSSTPRDTLERSARVVYQTGHTSGSDTVRGLLAGFEVWPDE